MIIYDGKEVVLHHHEGSTDYILITFMYSYPHYDARTLYSVKEVVEKRDITCLGISLHMQNWFISPEMDEVVELCNRITRHYKHVIIYGGSMGGFGALKYSRRLNATSVVCFGPQYSLDPDEHHIPAEYQKISENLRDRLRGMGIKPGDVGGDVYLLYDPKEAYDASNVRKIVAAAPDIKLVHTFYTGHPVPAHMKGSAVTARLFEHLARGNEQEIRHYISCVRRRNPGNINARLGKALPAHPLLAYRTLFSPRLGQLAGVHEVYGAVGLYMRLVFWLLDRGYRHEALRVHAALVSYHACGRFEAQAPAATAGVAGRYLLLSMHGDIVGYDSKERKFRGRALVQPGKAVSFVYIKPALKRDEVVVMIGGLEFGLGVEGDRLSPSPSPSSGASSGSPVGQTHQRIEVEYGDNGAAYLKTPLGYVFCGYSGQMGMISPHRQGWEKFHLLPAA